MLREALKSTLPQALTRMPRSPEHGAPLKNVLSLPPDSWLGLKFMGRIWQDDSLWSERFY